MHLLPLLPRLVATTLISAMAVAVNAQPQKFQGSATIVGSDNSHGQLTDFLSGVPNAGDTLTFSLTYDPDTLGAFVSGGPGIGFYAGGLTDVSFTLNGVTLSADTTPANQSSVLVTTLQTPGVLGIPGFFDGYGLTGGSARDANGNRWAVNFFFYDFDGANQLPNLDAPTTIPSLSDFAFVGLGFRSFDRNDEFDGFGSLLNRLEPVPDPNPVPAPAMGLMALAALWRRKKVLVSQRANRNPV